jgi:hypothetical protein
LFFEEFCFDGLATERRLGRFFFAGFGFGFRWETMDARNWGSQSAQ